ncbi:hypothetical protein B0H21DRAFT_146949 [Amylocystis lapponica]|nr:hypothetical protein B0H21DRAFT_146949 [Amylocystis lapponica]
MAQAAGTAIYNSCKYMHSQLPVLCRYWHAHHLSPSSYLCHEANKITHTRTPVAVFAFRLPRFPRSFVSVSLSRSHFDLSFAMALSHIEDVAARPALHLKLTLPAGADNAWSMVDSPTFGRATQSLGVVDRASRSTPPSVSPAKLRNVLPLNIKKARRKALLSCVPLVFPISPLPPATPMRTPSTSGHTPQIALTFTAEWDSNQMEFFFSPVNEHIPPTAAIPKSLLSPAPNDMDEEFPADAKPQRCPYGARPSASSFSSTSSIVSCPDSFFIHERKQSVSTAPSTPAYDCEPMEVAQAPYVHKARYLFQEELHRATAVPEAEAFDPACLDGLDDELLLHPWDAFTALCRAPMSDDMALGITCISPSPLLCRDKPLPDVPADATERCGVGHDEVC